MPRTLRLMLGPLALALALTLAPALAAGQDLKITGSTTVLPIAQKAAEVFMRLHPETRISVAGTGSGDGIKAIIDGTADIGNSSREMKPKELDLARERGVNPAATAVALDCIVPVVNPANPVKDLSLEQLRDIYAGEVRNWKQVGGEDKPVVAVSRDTSSGTFEVWNEHVLGKARVRPDAQMQASNGAVAQAVAGNKYAIGYVGLGYLNPQLKALSVGGVTASAQSAKDKSYPIARPLLMYTARPPEGLVKQFLDYLLGRDGQKIVLEEGFVPLH